MRKKYVHLACIWLVFIALVTLGAQCEQSGSPNSDFFSPIDPAFTKYIAIGDSITQGHMSGDANYFTQGYAYPYLLGKQMNTEVAAPYMVAESSGELFFIDNTNPNFAAIKTGLDGGTVHADIVTEFGKNNIALSGNQFAEVITAGSEWIIHDQTRNWRVKDLSSSTKLGFYGLYHRMIPGLVSNNLGVSGMDIALTHYIKSLNPLATDKGVFYWQRSTTFTNASFSDTSLIFVDELDATLSPNGTGGPGTAVEVAKSMNPTFVTFWLGNNDALGCVAGTGSRSKIDSTKYSTGLPTNFVAIIEGGKNFQNDYITAVINPLSPTLAAGVFAAQLDDADPRGAGMGYRPVERMSQAGAPHNFQTEFQKAITEVLKANNNTVKVAVGNIPDVTAIAHLFSFAEAKQFFITYGGALSSDLDTVWGTGVGKGFGGDENAKIPLDIVILGLNIYNNLKGPLGSTTALGLLSKGEGVGTNGTSGNNVALFDWDVNNLTNTEAGTPTAVINGLNAAILAELNALSDSQRVRVVLVDINALFTTIKGSGMVVNDGAGNSVGVPNLTRSYPGSQDPTGSNPNGGLFSLDGVHPGPTAHARVANEFIKAINRPVNPILANTNPATDGFGLNIPLINEYSVWLKDPFVDHDSDGYILGFPFTKQSSLSVILRDPNDADPSQKP